MGDACKLWCSGYGALIWTQFLPTSSQRRDATILLLFDSGDGSQRADDGGAVCAKLGVGVGGHRGFSSDGNSTSRDGGPLRISRGIWVGLVLTFHM
jgi:hypothetical protein